MAASNSSCNGIFHCLLVLLVLMASVPAIALRGQSPSKTLPRDTKTSPKLLARMGSTHFRHAGRIMCLAWSPDGKLLATAGQTELVRVWNIKTGRLVSEIKTIGHCVTKMVLTPDGKRLVAICPHVVEGKNVYVICVSDLRSGREIRNFALEDSQDFNAQISRNGRIVATFDKAEDAGKASYLCVWDTTTGKRSARRKITEKDVTLSTLRPDGRQVCLYKKDGTLIVQEAISGKEVLRWRGPKVARPAIAYSGNGANLAMIDAGELHVWSTDSGRETACYKIGAEYVRRLLFGVGNKTILVNEGKAISLWDIQSGKRMHHMPADGFITFYSMALAPDGATLATGGGFEVTPRLWDLRTGKEITPNVIQGHRFDGGKPAFSPDGKRIVMIDSRGNGHVWESATGKDLGRFSFGGKKAVWTTHMPVYVEKGNKILAADARGEMHEWDTTSLKLIRKWHVSRGVNSQSLSRDKKTLVLSQWRRIVSVWNIAAGKLLKSFAVPEGRVDPVCCCSDGRFIAAGCTLEKKINKKYASVGVVRLWDMKQGEEIAVFRGFKGHLFCLGLSPDARTIVAAGHEDDSVRLIEVATGKERGRLLPAGKYPGTAVFSPGGRLLALSTYKGVKLFDVATGKQIWHTPPITWHCAWPSFSPDGNVLALSWTDGLVETWKMPVLPNGKPLGAAELERCWRDLANADAKKAWPAICRLRLSPDNTLTFLKNHFKPSHLSKARKQELDRWIADLNSERFPVRTKATAQLRRAGELARPQLKNWLAKPALSLEMHQRLEQLLGALNRTPPAGETLQTIRALEVLENIGGEQARVLVDRLAKGESGTRTTDEAVRCLRRW